MVTDLLSISIVGVVLSVFIEFVQAKFGTSSNATKLLVVALAIAIGVLYTLFSATVWYQTAITVLLVASTVYSLIFSGKNLLGNTKV